jgi:hypothetical protein
MIVDDWYNFWIANYKEGIVADNTAKNYKNRYKANIKKEIGNMKLGDVKQLHCQRILNDMFENGREVVVTMRRFDTADYTFDEEFDYQGDAVELADLIDLWFSENTVNGRYSLNERTQDVLKFEQVRIPLYGKNIAGRDVAIDTRGFVRPLVKMLKDEPYYIPVTVYQKGLGEVWLIIGEE